MCEVGHPTDRQPLLRASRVSLLYGALPLIFLYLMLMLQLKASDRGLYTSPISAWRGLRLQETPTKKVVYYSRTSLPASLSASPPAPDGLCLPLFPFPRDANEDGDGGYSAVTKALLSIAMTVDSSSDAEGCIGVSINNSTTVTSCCRSNLDVIVGVKHGGFGNETISDITSVEETFSCALDMKSIDSEGSTNVSLSRPVPCNEQGAVAAVGTLTLERETAKDPAFVDVCNGHGASLYFQLPCVCNDGWEGENCLHEASSGSSNSGSGEGGGANSTSSSSSSSTTNDGSNSGGGVATSVIIMIVATTLFVLSVVAFLLRYFLFRPSPPARHNSLGSPFLQDKSYFVHNDNDSVSTLSMKGEGKGAGAGTWRKGRSDENEGGGGDRDLGSSGSNTTNIMIDLKQIVLHEVIGSGATGQVYRGTYQWMTVAVKQLHSNGKTKRAHVDSFFKREAIILSRLNHVNVLRFYGAAFKKQSQILSIVTEYHPHNLSEVVEEDSVCWTPQDMLTTARQIATGMAYLHSRNVVHRDLKPPNVLVSESGIAKICDFGIAKLVEDNVVTSMTLGVGTPAFMAPELMIYAASNDDIDSSKVDVYSFGVLLNYMWTRSLPYNKTFHPPFQFMSQVMRGTLRPEIKPDTPDEMLDLIEACWHTDPAQRPSFVEVIEALNSPGILDPPVVSIAHVQEIIPIGNDVFFTKVLKAEHGHSSGANAGGVLKAKRKRGSASSLVVTDRERGLRGGGRRRGAGKLPRGGKRRSASSGNHVNNNCVSDMSDVSSIGTAPYLTDEELASATLSVVSSAVA